MRSIVQTSGSILDFGRGPGMMSLLLADYGYQFFGVDGAPRMIATVRAETWRRGVSRFRLVGTILFVVARKQIR